MTALASEPLVSVPFLDLACMHRELKDELLAEIADLIDTGAFTNGPQVAAFEERFATYCGARHCVGVASGLDALRLALIAGGLEPGDEVVVPAHTFVATLEAVTQAGGVPVPADVSEDDLNLDPDAAAAAIGPRTRILMPVHLYGQVADVVRLRALADTHGLDLVEDACQAHGAERDGIAAGASGRASAFSFYPGKNLGAFGDAGALVTDDPEIDARVRALREHGQRAKYAHALEGWTARLDTIQALVLIRKLARLDDWNADRRRVAARYAEELEGIDDLALPPVPAASRPVWHLYVIRSPRRDALAAHLAERRIATGRHYPDAVHMTEAYAGLGYGQGAFPVAERLAAEGLSLPIFPGMSDAQIDAVVTSVRGFFGRG
jgi:dTDP-4-amino-4,6-dideoxygalactose transaminase